jgi:translation initiation factor IF-1
MANFKVGDQVSWIKKMACVPHPEGKTDRDGNILPVFRDTVIKGRIISWGGSGEWFVRPEDAEAHKDRICGERYYDIKIAEEDIILG